MHDIRATPAAHFLELKLNESDLFDQSDAPAPTTTNDQRFRVRVLRVRRATAHQHTYKHQYPYGKLCCVVCVYAPRSSYHNAGKLLRGVSSPLVDGFLHF